MLRGLRGLRHAAARDYLALGGLCLTLPFHFNDVDLSLKVRSSGKRIVWTPSARLYHFESGSSQVGAGQTQGDLVWRRWGHLLEGIDPYWRCPNSSWRSAVDSRHASVDFHTANLAAAPSVGSPAGPGPEADHLAHAV